MAFDIGLFAALGFIFAAYAVVGNDALQTLGTFINSNSRLHWTILFMFAAFILVATFTYGYIINGGDPSWGRLSNTSKYPVVDIQWYHTLPPLVLLIITRFGVPVSTSFMVLTVFASISGLSSMLQKSLMGYGLAFVVGLGLFLLLAPTVERFFRKHEAGDKAPWGLASIMGAITGAAIYYLPPMLTNALGVDEVSYSAGVCIGIAIAGVIVDIVASIAVIRFKTSFTSLALSAIVSAALALVLFQFLPDAGLMLGGADVGKTTLIVGLSLMTLILLYLIAHYVQSGKVVYWVILQWITTGYLWGVWLIQDFANIFVFLPRQLTVLESFGAMGVIVLLLGYTFWNKGGPVQKILQSKTAVTDIRSATIIDFVYASLLFLFKEVSDIPMSTTFVFLGLIAGREFGFAIISKAFDFVKTSILALSDASKAFIGLALSINMAVGLPWLAKSISEGVFDTAALVPTMRYGIFLLLVNLMLIPVFLFLNKKNAGTAAMIASVFAAAAVAFFTIPLEVSS